MLVIEDLCIERGSRIVVRNFSARVESGSALFLQGQNGSGKTSLLRAIAGFLIPVHGKILWKGVALTESLRKENNLIAYVGHQDAIKGALTVRENLVFWANLFGQKNIEEALKVMELVDLRDRPVRLLSQGQKRRLGLARLFLGRFDLWLLDEPMTNLDASTSTKVSSAIRHHLAEGGIALIAQHHPIDVPGRVTLLGEEGNPA